MKKNIAQTIFAYRSLLATRLAQIDEGIALLNRGLAEVTTTPKRRVARTPHRGSRAGIIQATLNGMTPGTTLRAIDLLAGLKKTGRNKALATYYLGRALAAGQVTRTGRGMYRVEA